MDVPVERVRVLGPEVCLDASNGEVHLGELPRRGVAFLPEDGQVPQLAPMGKDELFALDEHPRRTAAGIVDASLVGLEHLHEELHNAARRIELAAFLPFAACELREKVLVDPPEDILGTVLLVPQSDLRDDVDELAQTGLVELGARVVLWKDPPEGGAAHRVLLLDEFHCVIDDDPDGRLLRVVLEVGPAGLLGDPEDVLRAVAVLVLDLVGRFLLELRALLLERIGDVLQEDQTEDHMLVLGGVHVAAKLVRGRPHALLEAEVGAAARLRARFFARAGHALLHRHRLRV